MSDWTHRYAVISRQDLRAWVRGFRQVSKDEWDEFIDIKQPIALFREIGEKDECVFFLMAPRQPQTKQGNRYNNRADRTDVIVEVSYRTPKGASLFSSMRDDTAVDIYRVSQVEEMLDNHPAHKVNRRILRRARTARSRAI